MQGHWYMTFSEAVTALIAVLSGLGPGVRVCGGAVQSTEMIGAVERPLVSVGCNNTVSAAHRTRLSIARLDFL